MANESGAVECAGRFVAATADVRRRFLARLTLLERGSEVKAPRRFWVVIQSIFWLSPEFAEL